jgi:hypothetical protein
MNPLAIAALIIGGAVAVSMLARKTNATHRWLERYWARLEQLPVGFQLLGRNATAIFRGSEQAAHRLRSIDEGGGYPDRFVESTVAAQFWGPGQIHALADSVVSLITISESGEQWIGLSHLDEPGLSSVYMTRNSYFNEEEYAADVAGSEGRYSLEDLRKDNTSETDSIARVGLGQFVHAGSVVIDVVGGNLHFVQLQQRLVPVAGVALERGTFAVNIHEWLAEHNVAVSGESENWG